MTLRVCFYSCIFLFSHCLWAESGATVRADSATGSEQKFILKDAEIRFVESKTEPSSDASDETTNAENIEVLMPVPVQKILLRDAEIKMQLSERIFIRRKIDFSYVSWQENIRANLNSNSVVLNLQVEGIHLGGNWIVGTNRWQFIIEGFGEALTTIATEDSSALTFRQKSVATYAIGTGIVWPFFYTPGASMIGIGVRARGRIVDLTKPSSQDSFSGRETVLASLEIPASWRIAERWAIHESLGFSFKDSSTFFQIGAQWSFR